MTLQIYLGTILVVFISGIQSLTVQIFPDKDGILGPNDLKLSCVFSPAAGEEVFSIKIQAKFSGSFVDIASFSTIVNGNANFIKPGGEYLLLRANVSNPSTSSPNTASIIFDDITCEDEKQYKCKIVYITSSGRFQTIFSDPTSIVGKGMPAVPDNVPTWTPETGIEEGTNVTFTCTGNVGKPAGRFRWTKYRASTQTVYDSVVTTSVVMSGTCTFNGTSSLTLPLQAGDNNAVIKCEVVQEFATNNMYKQTRHDDLVVYYKVKNVSIAKSPNLPAYDEGATSVTMTCSAQGNPRPSFTWYRDSNRKSPLATGNTFRLGKGDVVVNNTGNYVCVGHNTFNGKYYEEEQTISIKIDKHVQSTPNCTFMAENLKVLDDSSFKSKLLYINIEFKNGTESPENLTESPIFMPLEWIRITESQHSGILQLKPNFEILSLNSLTVQTERVHLKLQDTPLGCLQGVNETDYTSIVRTFLFNIFKEEGTEICNIGIENVNGYAEFYHTCCEHDSKNNIACQRVEKNYWLKTLDVITYVMITLAILYCPLVIPTRFYERKYSPNTFEYTPATLMTVSVNVKDDESVSMWQNNYLNSTVWKEKNISVERKQINDQISDQPKREKINTYKKLKKNTNCELFVSALKFHIRNDEIVSENEAPTSLLSTFYDAFIECGIRDKSGDYANEASIERGKNDKYNSNYQTNNTSIEFKTEDKSGDNATNCSFKFESQGESSNHSNNAPSDREITNKSSDTSNNGIKDQPKKNVNDVSTNTTSIEFKTENKSDDNAPNASDKFESQGEPSNHSNNAPSDREITNKSSDTSKNGIKDQPKNNVNDVSKKSENSCDKKATDCCHANVFGKCTQGKVYPWYKCLRSFMHIVLFLVACLPWVIRITVYFIYESDIRLTRHKAANDRNLKMKFGENLTYFLTPIHVLFLVCYGVLAFDYIIFGFFVKKLKTGLQTMIQTCLTGIHNTKKKYAFKWAFRFLTKPFTEFGIFGFIIAPMFWMIAIPFVVLVLSFRVFPTIHLAFSLTWNFSSFFYRSNGNKNNSENESNENKNDSDNKSNGNKNDIENDNNGNKNDIQNDNNGNKNDIQNDNNGNKNDIQNESNGNSNDREKDKLLENEQGKNTRDCSFVSRLSRFLNFEPKEAGEKGNAKVIDLQFRNKDIPNPILRFFMILTTLLTTISFVVLAVECIIFIIEVAVYTMIGLILNSSHAMQYVSVVSIGMLYYNSCFNGVKQVYSKYYKFIHMFLLKNNEEEVTKIAEKPREVQNNTAFRIKPVCLKDTKTKQSDFIPKLVTADETIRSGSNPKCVTNGVVLFLDESDTRYISKEFFFDVCTIHPQCPGELSHHLLIAFRRFISIVIFLLFVTVIVLAFGDAYSISISNQLHATVAGGFVPWLLMKSDILFSKPTEPDFEQLAENLNFKSSFNEMLSTHRELWRVSEIILGDDNEIPGETTKKNDTDEISNIIKVLGDYNEIPGEITKKNDTDEISNIIKESVQVLQEIDKRVKRHTGKFNDKINELTCTKEREELLGKLNQNIEVV